MPAGRADDVGVSGFVKFLAVVALVGAGYVAYILYEGRAYGVSEQHPLGKFGRIDKHLTKTIGLERSPVTRVRIAGIGTAPQMFEFRNPSSAKEFVVVQLDANERVIGVVGTYVVYEIGRSTSGTANFLRSHWRLAGGAAAPDFTGQRSGRTFTATSEFTGAQIRGTWRKITAQEKSEVIYLRIK